VLWAGFWLFFFVVESIAWQTPITRMAPWVLAGCLFVLLAALAWRAELTGGALLLTAGTLVGLAYLAWPPEGLAPSVRVVTAAMLAVPPVVSGMLFIAHHRAVSGRPA
jgi:hypothetical protein